MFAQNYLTQSFANDWQIYLGAIFVLMVLVLPGGLAGGGRLALSWFASRAGPRVRRRQPGSDPDGPEIEQGAGDSMVGVSE